MVEIRKRLNVTQLELASYLGVTSSTLRTIEHLDPERLGRVTLETLAMVADAVGKRPVDLVPGLLKKTSERAKVRPGTMRLERSRRRAEVEKEMVKEP